MRFHIVVAMYNASHAIEKNIHAIRSQTFTNFQCILIDDISTDDTFACMRAAVDGDERFRLVLNEEKKYKTRNVVDGIEMANADDEDVIVLIDGDDLLADENALQIVADTYAKDDCWMTYGSSCLPDGSPNSVNRPYADRIVRKNAYRQTRWLASHLKTFKYKLWKRLDLDIFQITDDECRKMRWRALRQLRPRAWWYWRNIKAATLHDATGKYIRRVDDKAFTYAMLEMSGPRASYIEEILYIYQPERLGGAPDTNYGAAEREKWHTRLVREILKYQKPYDRLEEL
jgi:glycosyltransferase involved in cell wall biosynthesis